MMITTTAGPEVKDGCSRQVLVVPPEHWREWFNPEVDVRKFFDLPRPGTFSFGPTS